MPDYFDELIFFGDIKLLILYIKNVILDSSFHFDPELLIYSYIFFNKLLFLKI